jgi:hypothetical protein
MFLNEFNHTAKQKVGKINKLLKEEFGISLAKQVPSRTKLKTVLESADIALSRIRNSNKMYQVHPEYSKYLGLRAAINIMLNEGMYAESPKYNEMKQMVNDSVRQLMDRGYTQDEAVSECMNRYRMDNRFAYDDQHVLPIVINAAKTYMEQCRSGGSGLTEEPNGQDAPVFPSTNLKDVGLKEMARECGIELEDTQSLSAIEQKLEAFARVSGKSRDAIVEFLNGLQEEQLTDGIRMFGRKIAEANKFVSARKAAIKAGKKEFEVDGKKYKVTGDTTDELAESFQAGMNEEFAKGSAEYQIIQDLINGDLDAYAAMGQRGGTPAQQKVAGILHDMYDNVVIDYNLHPDDDFESIIEVIMTRLQDRYDPDGYVVKEESSMRLVKKGEQGSKSFKIYKDQDFGEYVVKFYKNGEHQTEADYHTDDVRDAMQTAKSEVSRMTESKKAKEPYAVGMAAAMKSTGDKPPLKKSTITKAHKIAKKVSRNESMLNGIISSLITEEVAVEQAELVMAVRALADDIQDQIERIGRMMNEDIPAISDQMRSEMGAQTAQGFVDSVNAVLSAYIEAAKSAKAGMDQASGSLTGETPAADLGPVPAAEPEMPTEPSDTDAEPAAEPNPLGRAQVQI